MRYHWTYQNTPLAVLIAAFIFAVVCIVIRYYKVLAH